MKLGLEGRVALVTAASRGFGRAVALELVGEGAHVALCARGAEDLERTRAEVQAVAGSGVRLLARPCDVSDGPAVERFVAEVTRELGPIDALLVNAGGPPAGGFFATGLDQWEAAYRLNLESAVRLCRLVLPGMMERGWGRIVQITSVAQKQPVDNLVLSNVIRPAVHALTRCLAIEAAPRGVTVNSVAPGFHLTSAVERLVRHQLDQGTATSREEVLAGWEREIPAGRLGRAEELAALIVFLMSERAGYVTGQCLVADGGWVRSTF
jgi:3-oxoacyl-[acyl-carrier protein] reductase